MSASLSIKNLFSEFGWTYDHLARFVRVGIPPTSLMESSDFRTLVFVISIITKTLPWKQKWTPHSSLLLVFLLSCYTSYTFWLLVFKLCCLGAQDKLFDAKMTLFPPLHHSFQALKQVLWHCLPLFGGWLCCHSPSPNGSFPFSSPLSTMNNTFSYQVLWLKCHEQCLDGFSSCSLRCLFQFWSPGLDLCYHYTQVLHLVLLVFMMVLLLFSFDSFTLTSSSVAMDHLVSPWDFLYIQMWPHFCPFIRGGYTTITLSVFFMKHWIVNPIKTALWTNFATHFTWFALLLGSLSLTRLCPGFATIISSLQFHHLPTLLLMFLLCSMEYNDH